MGTGSWNCVLRVEDWRRGLMKHDVRLMMNHSPRTLLNGSMMKRGIDALASF